MAINKFKLVEISLVNCTVVIGRWQARKEGDRDMRAGLIPSRALQERRILHERAHDKGLKDGKSQH